MPGRSASPPPLTHRRAASPASFLFPYSSSSPYNHLPTNNIFHNHQQPQTSPQSTSRVKHADAQPRSGTRQTPVLLPFFVVGGVLALALCLAAPTVFEPDKCPSGKELLKGKCSPCPEGQYRVALSGFEGFMHRLRSPSFARCDTCPNNHRCASSAEYPEPCPTRWHSTLGKPCQQCPINTQPTRFSHCAQCPKGQVASGTSLCHTCPAGAAPIRETGSCQVCGKNTHVVIYASGYGACVDCAQGTHNPDPSKYSECVCKIGHQPRDGFRNGGKHGGASNNTLTCEPCPQGFFKLQTANAMDSCVKCPSDANTERTGSFLPSHCITTGLVQGVINSLKVQVEHALHLITRTIMDLWSSTLDYFREALNESWSTAEQMFAAFDREGYNVSVVNLTAGQTTTCTLVWFFCHTNFKEPDNPNACPYSSVEDMLVNIKAQPQWIEWRAAPLKDRASKARGIARQFHPDKWATFNPTCDIDHKGKWAEYITTRVIDIIVKDRAALRAQ